MWRKLTLLLISIATLLPSQLFGWGINTHYAITKIAVEDAEKAMNLHFFLNTFGLNGILPDEDPNPLIKVVPCLLPAHPSTDTLAEKNFFVLANNIGEFTYTDSRWLAIVECTAANLIAVGAILEDTNPDDCSDASITTIDQTPDNVCRSMRHFFEGEDGDDSDDDGLDFSGYTYVNARDWAILGEEDNVVWIQNLNSFRWKDKSFEYFGQAIVGSTPEERMIGKQRLFVTLGHTSHLLEDMFQPAHVRNDSHSDKVNDGKEYLEEFIQQHVSYEKYGTEETTYANLSSGYLAEEIKKASAPDMTVTPKEGEEFPVVRKLFDEAAAFTNKNFFSTDTIFQSYPSPNTNNTQFRTEQVLFWVFMDKVTGGFLRTSFTTEWRFAVSKSEKVDMIFNQNEMTRKNDKTVDGYGSNGTTKPRLTKQKSSGRCGPVEPLPDGRPGNSYFGFCEMQDPLNLVLLDNAMALLPKAVAYSRALVNHFFRGRIEATMNLPGQLTLKNISPDKLDEFKDGQVRIYYETSDGKVTELSSSAQKVEKLQAGQTMDVPFDWNVNYKRVIVLYDGKIGVERGVAATQAVFGDNVSLILSIDASASMAGDKLEKAKKAALNLLNVQGKTKGSRVAIHSFSDKVNPNEFTEDFSLAASQVNGLRDSSGTALYDAVIAAGETAVTEAKSHPQQQIIVLLFTDGDENSSTIKSKEMVVNAIRKQPTKEIDALLLVYVGGDANGSDATDLRSIALRGGWESSFAASVEELTSLFMNFVNSFIVSAPAGG